MKLTLLLIGEFDVPATDSLGSALSQLDAFREAVQPAAEYGLTLFQAAAADLVRCAACDDLHARHFADGGSCAVAGCGCEQFIVRPADAPGAPE